MSVYILTIYTVNIWISKGISNKTALYEIGDTLLIHKKRLEKELRKQEEALFPREHALFLYDLTNTYFEGRASKNTSAKRGHSKEKRSDCPLVTLALVVDYQGFPIFSEIYKGNQSEPETLDEILKRLYVEDETLFNETLPTIVMDRGIATKNNLELLKEKHYPYIVVEKRATEKDYAQDFTTAKDTFLVKVEEAFRDLKTDLGFRPVHHQLAERTEAHFFISVLAYHLLIVIERELRNSGDHRRWSTIKDVLSTHQRTTVIMTDDNDQIHHIRSLGVPESEHRW